MITPDSERLMRGPAGFADAVTFSFADEERGWFGLARLGVTSEGGGSALALVFSGREPVCAVARGGLEVGADADWSALALGGLTCTVEAPLAAWNVELEHGSHPFALRFEALGAPAELAPDDHAARVGGMAGYESFCRVTGTIAGETVEGLGQRGHSWGAPDWDRLALARTVSAWLDESLGVTLSAVRPATAGSHAEEAVWAALRSDDLVLQVAEPRLSTTYDDDGRQRRAGLELWLEDPSEDDDDDLWPHRAAGEALCGSTLELGALRLDCAFFRWRMEGRVGVGRYDILRRA